MFYVLLNPKYIFKKSDNILLSLPLSHVMAGSIKVTKSDIGGATKLFVNAFFLHDENNNKEQSKKPRKDTCVTLC